jgi:triosephosphate isomerase
MKGGRTRKYFLAANWKSNGNTQFVKEIISHMINSFEYESKKIGNQIFLLDEF